MASSTTQGAAVLSNNEYKVILIGAVGVGKTSLLVRYVFNTFEDSSMKAISEEKKTMTIDGQEIVLDLWDTAGQERFRTLTQRYYEGVDGVIVVYSCEYEESFGDITKYWFPEIVRYLSVDDIVKVPVLIVENKKDLIAAKENVVNFEHAKELAHQHNLLPPLQCSAKTGDDVKKVFHVIATEIYKSRRKVVKKARVKKTTPDESRGCACVKGSKSDKKSRLTVYSD